MDWKTWSELGYILYKIFLRILYLSYDETTLKSISSPGYCQILFAIPKGLKLRAMTIKKPLETIAEETDVYQLAEGKTICLSKMRFRDYYSLPQAKWETEPTSVQSWSKPPSSPSSPLPTNGITYLGTSQRCRQTIN